MSPGLPYMALRGQQVPMSPTGRSGYYVVSGYYDPLYTEDTASLCKGRHVCKEDWRSSRQGVLHFIGVSAKLVTLICQIHSREEMYVKLCVPGMGQYAFEIVHQSQPCAQTYNQVFSSTKCAFDWCQSKCPSCRMSFQRVLLLCWCLAAMQAYSAAPLPSSTSSNATVASVRGKIASTDDIVIIIHEKPSAEQDGAYMPEQLPESDIGYQAPAYDAYQPVPEHKPEQVYAPSKEQSHDDDQHTEYKQDSYYKPADEHKREEEEHKHKGSKADSEGYKPADKYQGKEQHQEHKVADDYSEYKQDSYKREGKEHKQYTDGDDDSYYKQDSYKPAGSYKRQEKENKQYTEGSGESEYKQDTYKPDSYKPADKYKGEVEDEYRGGEADSDYKPDSYKPSKQYKGEEEEQKKYKGDDDETNYKQDSYKPADKYKGEEKEHKQYKEYKGSDDESNYKQDSYKPADKYKRGDEEEHYTQYKYKGGDDEPKYKRGSYGYDGDHKEETYSRGTDEGKYAASHDSYGSYGAEHDHKATDADEYKEEPRYAKDTDSYQNKNEGYRAGESDEHSQDKYTQYKGHEEQHDTESNHEAAEYPVKDYPIKRTALSEEVTVTVVTKVRGKEHTFVATQPMAPTV